MHNLRCAANIVLEYDATRAKAVEAGEAVRVDAKRSRPRPSLRPRKADEVLSLRPQIEELIAPLVLEPIQKPALRPFQESGVQWLTDHKAGILADDMGLGKTAQALRALEGLVERGMIRSALVICPKSLIRKLGGRVRPLGTRANSHALRASSSRGRRGLVRDHWSIPHHHYKL